MDMSSLPNKPFPTAAQVAARLDPGWREALAPISDQIVSMMQVIAARRVQGEEIMPADDQVLRAFQQPFDQVRVIIIGQDPYPTPGHAVGLSFSMDPAVRPIARSLRNIYQELADDVRVASPEHGDLSAWADQGVLLLNRVLTVRAGQADSHAGGGWEAITEFAVRAAVNRDQPLVGILWGAKARKLAPLFAHNAQATVIESVHPSPLSASRGFFGSKPFSRTNDFLMAHGQAPIDWSLPEV